MELRDEVDARLVGWVSNGASMKQCAARHGWLRNGRTLVCGDGHGVAGDLAGAMLALSCRNHCGM